jgi:hypothetical protein
MDAGSRSEPKTGLIWRRAILAWMLIMVAETVHGVLRTLYIAPRIGDLRARQWGVLLGCLIIFAIAWGSARWIGAVTRSQQMAVGLSWAFLTVLFEFALGRALHYSWHRILSDYDLTRGGFMGAGLLFMVLAPALVAHSRSRT